MKHQPFQGDGEGLWRPNITGFKYLLSLATLISAPYFYLRPYGFDFSRGTSLSLVDLGLFMLLLLLLVEQRGMIFRHLANLVYAKVGVAFVASATLAALIGRLSAFESPFNWWNFISSLSQYGFIFVALPLLALRYFSNDLRQLIRWIAIAYLPPMLIGLIFLNHATPEGLRGMFYFANRALGTYGNANGFAMVILLTLPYYTYLAVADTGRWRQLGYLGQTSSLLSLLLTGSISGLLTLFALSLISAHLIFRFFPNVGWLKLAIYALTSMSLCIFMGFLVFLYEPLVIANMSPRLNSALVSMNNWLDGITAAPADIPDSVVAESASVRFELMWRALSSIINGYGNLFWGTGLGNSRFASLFTLGNTQLDVHNVYLLLWLEGGLTSALLFVTFLLVALLLVARMAKSERSIALTIVAVVSAMLLMGLNHPHIYLRYFWIPLLPALALVRSHRLSH